MDLIVIDSVAALKESATLREEIEGKVREKVGLGVGTGPLGDIKT